MRLISMTAFVLLERARKPYLDEYKIRLFDLFENYANFLSQNLSERYEVNGVSAHPLNRFVPTDLDGNVLEGPEGFDEFDSNPKYEEDRKYQQAKERVLFEGFRIELSLYENCYSLFVIDAEMPFSEYYFDTYHFNEGGFVRRKETTIEDLVSNCSKEITLTPTAQKMIGVNTNK